MQEGGKPRNDQRNKPVHCETLNQVSLITFHASSPTVPRIPSYACVAAEFHAEAKGQIEKPHARGTWHWHPEASGLATTRLRPSNVSTLIVIERPGAVNCHPPSPLGSSGPGVSSYSTIHCLAEIVVSARGLVAAAAVFPRASI